MKPKKVLVTGAAGFIGSNLCERLLSEGFLVVGADNLSSGSKDNLDHIIKDPSFEFIKHDITTPLFVEVDQIYNLASPSSPLTINTSPVMTMKTILLGTMNMLSLAKRTRATLLQASSGTIYGKVSSDPIAENSVGTNNHLNTGATYSESKRAAETMVATYGRIEGIDTRIARIFNTYGPRMPQNEGRIIASTIISALKGENITVYENGLQPHSCCFIDDTVEALFRLMNGPESTENQKCYYAGVAEGNYNMVYCTTDKNQADLSLPMNIGNPNVLSLRELIDKIVALTRSRSKVSYMNLSPQDTYPHTPDITRARQTIGWEPRTSIDAGLIKTINYFEQQLYDQIITHPYLSWVEMA